MSLLPYVPALAFRLLRDAHSPSRHPRSETLHAAVLLADLSGFTALADTLASRYNDRGAETLQDILNRYFGSLNEVVDDAGGEVLVYPGDAALALWVDDSEGREVSTSIGHAVACGLELQRRLDHLPAIDGITLRLRVAIGAGLGRATIVGIGEGQSHIVFNGQPVEQLSAALRVSHPGEVVLSPAARALGRLTVTGVERASHLVAMGTKSVDPRRPPTHRDSTLPDESIRTFVPSAVVARINAGQLAWLAEFRTVTVLYVRLAGLNSDDGRKIQDATVGVETIASEFEGAINQILADDKGVAVIVAFGAMERSHENDAERGVRAALAIVDALKQHEITARIGIATSRVFTGVRGGRTRLEFAMVGAGVVLAARLAFVAATVVCDAATRAACWQSIRFDPPSQMILKGKADPIEVWSPASVREAKRGVTAVTVGRTPERGLLQARVSALEQDGRGSIMLVLGEPGIGKTTLIDDLVKWTQGRAVRCFVGRGDAIERRAAYRCWRPIITSLLGFVPGGEAVRDKLGMMLGDEGARLAPLLSGLLPISLSDNDTTSAFDPETRAMVTRDLVGRLIELASQASPVLVVLEDVHWLDSASWGLAEHLIQHVPRLSLVMTARPPIDAIAAMTRLMSHESASTLRLGTLTDDEISELICRRLDVDGIPEALTELLHQRAEGHPLLAEELCRALRDNGTLAVRDSVCHLSATLTQSASVLPRTVEGLFRARIDQLTVQEQFTLKVASVLGRQFAQADVVAVHPLRQSEAEISHEIDGIIRSGLAQPLEGQPGSFWFTHAIIQEVTYDLLPFAQRRELHRLTAAWIEHEAASRLDEVSGLVAHHFERAEAWDKAILYLERAAVRALRDSSDREGEAFLRRLIELADRDGRPDEWIQVPKVGRLSERSIRRASWERLLAQAIVRQGRQTEALDHLTESLGMLGQTVPAPTMRATAQLVAWIAVRLMRRPARKTPPELVPPARIALLETIRGYNALVQYRYLSVGGERTARGREAIIQSSYALLYATRTAERLDTTPELSRAYSVLSTLLSFIGAPGQARFYSVQARQIAKQVGDRHALFQALTIGQLHAFVRGQWDDIAVSLDEAMVLGADLRMTHDCLLFEHALALVYLHQGRLTEATSRLHDVRARAQAHKDRLPELWAMATLAEIAFRRGEAAEAISLAEGSLVLAERHKIVDHNSRFQAHGLLAAAYLRQAQPDLAKRQMNKARLEADSGGYLSYSPQAGFCGVAEVLLAGVTEGDGLAKVALKAWLRRLRVMSFCRPILKPWASILRARYDVVRGRRRMARHQAHQAIETADRLCLVYEAGVARTELAALLSPANPERRTLEQEAREIFERIGVEPTRYEAF